MFGVVFPIAFACVLLTRLSLMVGRSVSMSGVGGEMVMSHAMLTRYNRWGYDTEYGWRYTYRYLPVCAYACNKIRSNFESLKLINTLLMTVLNMQR